MSGFNLKIKENKKVDFKNMYKSVFFCSSKKGITLIALVISIIVILILAGISLNASIGNNGIINKAQSAKLTQENATVEEQIVQMLEYYQTDGSDFGITINDIESISLLQKYVDGKINGFYYNPNGTTIVYYTNSNGSYTVKVDSQGKATTYTGIYLEANENANIIMSTEEGNNTIQLTTNMKDVVWASLNENIATVDSTTGKVTKIAEGIVKIKGKSITEDYVYVIISDDSSNEGQEELAQKEMQLVISTGKKWEDDVADGFARGDGTIGNPYQIENAQQLAYLAKTANNGETYEGKYIELIRDIDLEYISWTPICVGPQVSSTSENKFQGNFNGNGKTISKIYVEYPENSRVGLFGALGRNGVIENVNLKKGKIIGAKAVGGLVGYSAGNIKNCSSSLEVIATPVVGLNYTGQQAGRNSWIYCFGNDRKLLKYRNCHS